MNFQIVLLLALAALCAQADQNRKREVFFTSNGIISNYTVVMTTISSELDAERQVMNIRTITHIDQVISNDPNYRPPQEENSDGEIATEASAPMPVRPQPRIRPQIPARFDLNLRRPRVRPEFNSESHVQPQASSGDLSRSEAGSSFDVHEPDSSEIRQNSGKGFSMINRALNFISKSSQPSRMFQATARSMSHPKDNIQPEDSNNFIIDLPIVDPRVQQALELPKNSEDRKSAFLKLAREYGQKQRKRELNEKKSVLDELRRVHTDYDVSLWHTPLENKMFDGDEETQKETLKYDSSLAKLVHDDEYIQNLEQELDDLHKKYPLYDHSLLRIVDADEPQSESGKQESRIIDLDKVQEHELLEEEQNSKGKQPIKSENESKDVQNRLGMYDASVHHLILNDNDDDKTTGPPPMVLAAMFGAPSSFLPDYKHISEANPRWRYWMAHLKDRPRASPGSQPRGNTFG